jgi:hypothetical protein
MEAELREQDEYTMKVVVFRIQVRGHCTRSLGAPLLRVMRGGLLLVHSHWGMCAECKVPGSVWGEPRDVLERAWLQVGRVLDLVVCDWQPSTSCTMCTQGRRDSTVVSNRLTQFTGLLVTAIL